MSDLIKHIAALLPGPINTGKHINRTGLDVILPFYHAVSDQLLPHTKHLFSLRSSVQFENDLDYLFGDSTTIDGGMIYVWSPIVSISAQINARITRRDQFIGTPVPSTGGEFVNFTPGVTLAATDNLSFYTHVQIPIYQRVNEVNLVPNFGLLFGASYGFNALQ